MIRCSAFFKIIQKRRFSPFGSIKIKGSGWIAVLIVLSTSLFVDTGMLSGEESPKVLLLPFKIFSEQPQPYLEKEIPLAIKNRILQEGGEVLIHEEPAVSVEVEKEAGVYRELGLKSRV
ncbi:MAG: hypothetical protein AB1659_13190, partial [Thermodesulfobacteriota bacterium]